MWLSLYAGFLLALPGDPLAGLGVLRAGGRPGARADAAGVRRSSRRCCSWSGSLFGYCVALPAAAHFLTNYDNDAVHDPHPGAATTSRSRRRCSRDGDRLRAAAVRRRAHPPRRSSRPARCAGTGASATSSSPASAVALPGVDPVTTMLETMPLLILFEARSGCRSCSTGAPSAPPPPPAPRERRSERTAELSADWVLPVDGPPIEGGRVRWEGGEIVEVGPGRAERHYDRRGDPARVRQRPLAPRVRRLRGLRRRHPVRRRGSRPTSSARRRLVGRRHGRDRPPRRRRLARGPGSRRPPTTASPAPRRSRPPSSGCARSSTSRCSPPIRTTHGGSSRRSARSSRRRRS